MKKKLGLALGAGGTRGIAHIGFLKALEEEGIRPDYISGSSMGSIVGACYAKGMSPDEMLDIIKKLTAFDIMDIGFPVLSTLGLMRWNKVRRMMSSFLGDCSFEELEIPFSCVSVDVKSGKLVEFHEGKVVDAILASSSIPTIFRPVEKDGMLLVDGSVRCRVPVRQVKHMGADVVVAVDVLGPAAEVEKVPNVIALIARVYEIMDASAAERDRRGSRRFVDLWIEPQMGNVSQTKLKYEPAAFEGGYAAGKENAEKIRALLGE